MLPRQHGEGGMKEESGKKRRGGGVRRGIQACGCLQVMMMMTMLHRVKGKR